MDRKAKRVYSHESLAMVGHMKNVLAHHGVDSEVRNQGLGSVVGEIPPVECWPTLWVSDPILVDRAEELVAAELADEGNSHPAWRCGTCGADNEGQYAACWQCGRADGD